MATLWGKLLMEMGKGFTSQNGDAGGDVFNHWAVELQFFHRDEIAMAFAAWRDGESDFLNLKIFRDLCKKAQLKRLGLPDEQKAYTLVLNRQWEKLHPAFQFIASETEEIEEVVAHFKEGDVGDFTDTALRLRYDLNLKGLDEWDALKKFKPYFREVVYRISKGEHFERRKSVTKSSNPSGTTHTKKFGKDRGRTEFKEILKQMKGA